MKDHYTLADDYRVVMPIAGRYWISMRHVEMMTAERTAADLRRRGCDARAMHYRDIPPFRDWASPNRKAKG